MTVDCDYCDNTYAGYVHPKCTEEWEHGLAGSIYVRCGRRFVKSDSSRCHVCNDKTPYQNYPGGRL